MADGDNVTTLLFYLYKILNPRPYLCTYLKAR